MRFGSVCSGIEAASVAWHPLGWKAAWLSEIEPFPSAVLAHHYPDVPNLGDMTKLPELIDTGLLEAPDVFCGGTPCQAFSVAGLRKSLDDARGNLSLTFCEIANAIDNKRIATRMAPTIIFWENVPGVLSTKDNAFGCFLGALAGEDDPIIPSGEKWTNAGCVYGPQRTVAWRVFDAQYFGVAQRRRRVFVVASARNDFDPAAVLFEFDGLRRDIAPSRKAGKEATRDAGVSVNFSCAGIGAYTNEDIAASLLKSGQDLGNGCEALISQPVKRETVQTLRCKRPGEGGMSGDDEHLIPMISPALNTESGANHAPDTKAYVVQPICLMDQGGSVMNVEHDIVGTLRRETHGHEPSVIQPPSMAVRRLTPVECERLQGFPDSYTNIPWRKKPASECPDGPRYKALGNSWAVPVVRWIGKRIQEAIQC